MNCSVPTWCASIIFAASKVCWAIPAGAATAVNGRWEPTPGGELFRALCAVFPDPPIIAEDLGVITPEVDALRREFGFAGMKILQFAFDSGPDNPYLPHNYRPDCVVYTGTHDNTTTRAWWDALSLPQQQRIGRYLGTVRPDIPGDLIRLAMASVAQLCIIPCQDLLGLGEEARFNRPGVAIGNWRWRLRHGQLTTALAEQLRALATIYNRAGS